MDTDESLIASALAWSAADPDPETAEELRALIEHEEMNELRERLSKPLTFGTAGLRGLVGAGPARMNRAVVIRTTRALVEYLLAHEPEARTLPVVIGFDARHSSVALAEAAMQVLAAARVPVRYFREPEPTPLVAYAIRQLAATAGIVVTASHNPGEYNGYKLYAKNGVQVIPPMDADIERRLETIGPANAIPRVSEPFGRMPFSTPVPESIADRYLADIDALRPRGDADRSFGIVYTPMHGVGGALATKALAIAGFSNVTVVPEQAAPDGDFPTVRFPNPEEKGALDLAVRLATECRADLILANDPDADRLAVSVPSPAGRFVLLTGNQIGVLLADFILSRAPSTPTPLVLSSIVSTPMLAEVAAHHGARCEVTLTGFKWIWSAALVLEKNEHVRYQFGFEEAIGFSAGHVVRDKDGIGTAVLFAEFAARCRASKVSVLEKLRELYVRYGLWVSAQQSIVRPGVDGLSEISAAVDRLGASPPATLGDIAVTAVVDYRKGAEKRPLWLGTSPLVVLDLGRSGRALLRPSGTEPKLKIYVDLRGDAPATGDFEASESALRRDAAALAAELAAYLGF